MPIKVKIREPRREESPCMFPERLFPQEVREEIIKKSIENSKKRHLRNRDSHKSLGLDKLTTKEIGEKSKNIYSYLSVQSFNEEMKKRFVSYDINEVGEAIY